MAHLKKLHTGTIIYALFILLLTPVFTACGCGCGCCCCDSPDDGDKSLWYRTMIDATYDREWFVPVTPRYNWTEHWPDSIGIDPQALEFPLPAGLRVVTFTSDGKADHHNLDTHGGEVRMTGETTGLLFYNNDTEYILYKNTDSFTEATATTRRRNVTFYSGNPRIGSDTVSEPVMSQPDMLYRRSLKEQAVDSALRIGESSPEDIHNIPVTLVPAVYVYVIHFGFDKGLNYVLNASAALSGVSAGVNLSTGNTLDNACTLIFDCEKTADGITGTVMSFGAPEYQPENPELYHPDRRYGITLRVVLTNSRIISFTADITGQMAAQPSGGIVMVGGLEIDEEDSKPTGGGSFDVTVDPWGAPNDYEINL